MKIQRTKSEKHYVNRYGWYVPADVSPYGDWDWTLQFSPTKK